MTNYALHIGLPVEGIVGLVKEFKPNAGYDFVAEDIHTPAVHVDGDLWEEWGERVASEDGKETVEEPLFHVVIGCASVGHAFAILEHLVLGDERDSMPAWGSLEPMRYPAYQKGIIASVSKYDEWSECLLNVAEGHHGLTTVDKVA